MFRAMILGLTMLVSLSYAQNTKHNNSLKTLNTFVTSEIGFSGVALDKGLSSDLVLEKIKKEDWSKTRTKLSGLIKDKIKVGKLVVSDSYGLDLNFFYSSYSTNFELTIYVRSDEDVSNIKNAIENLCSYSSMLIKDLSLLSDEAIYSATVHLRNVDRVALDAMLRMDDNKILHSQAYFIISELEKDETVKTKIQKLLADDQLTDKDKIEKIIKIFTKKNLYKGELKLFVNLGASYVISSLKTIINTSSDDYVKPAEDDLSTILEYHELTSHFHDFISKVNKDDYAYLYINMKEGASLSYYDEYVFTLYLNIEDLFYDKDTITKK